MSCITTCIQPKKVKGNSYVSIVRYCLFMIFVVVCFGVVSTSSFDNNSLNNMSMRNQVNRKNQINGVVDNCVWNETDLRKAIDNTPNRSISILTNNIDLCSNYISIDAHKLDVSTNISGINILNKYINFTCHLMNSSEKCVIDAQRLSRHFYIDNNATVLFHNINLINGKTKYNLGGSISIGSSVIQMNDCSFINNTAGSGGAVFSDDYTNASYNNVLFKNNKALTFGGAVFSHNYTNASYNNVLFESNTVSGYGGAVYSSDYTDASYSNVLFKSNWAESGGAVYSHYKTDASYNNVSFESNTAALERGGAVYNSAFNNASYNNVSFESNTAALYGGAVYSSFYSNDVYNNVLFKSNLANISGGAVYSSLNRNASYSNVSFESNSAKLEGGAVLSDWSNSILKDVVLTNNTANEGGGIYAKELSTLQCNNVVFQDNSADTGAAVAIEDSTLVLSSVTMTNNLAPNGTIAIFDSKISVKDVSFYRADSDVDSCDIFISSEDEDDGGFRVSRVNFPMKPPQQGKRQSSQPTCVSTEAELRETVDMCINTMNETSCQIDVCQEKITITRSSRSLLTNAISTGINVSNKNILLTCQNQFTKQRCTLDGLGQSRIFYGTEANITLQNFILANGFHPIEGGAIMMGNNSIVTLSNWSFWNNSAPYGSAISVDKTTLIIDGTETAIVNNIGNGPSLKVFSSLLNISHAVFGRSCVSEFGTAILMFGSTLNVVYVTSNNSTNASKNCDVYVSLYENISKLESSCVNFPMGRDLGNYCPSTSPTFSPTTTTLSRSASSSPSSTFNTVPTKSPTTRAPTSITSPTKPPTSPPWWSVICFSGNNMVEVNKKGLIPMNQLQIGDYVMSGDGKVTQVYGFGHLEHDKEETFLKIDFNYSTWNQTINNSSCNLQISSDHLVFVNRIDNKYPIRASDVVVADVLNGRKVIAIRHVIGYGIYAPLTYSGDIVVSGVVASNYVDILHVDNWMSIQHNLGHAIFYPQRLLCSYFLEHCKKERYFNGYGYVSYLTVHVASAFHELIFKIITIFPSLTIINFVGSFVLVALIILMIRLFNNEII